MLFQKTQLKERERKGDEERAIEVLQNERISSFRTKCDSIVWPLT